MIEAGGGPDARCAPAGPHDGGGVKLRASVPTPAAPPQEKRSRLPGTTRLHAVGLVQMIFLIKMVEFESLGFWDDTS